MSGNTTPVTDLSPQPSPHIIVDKITHNFRAYDIMKLVGVILLVGGATLTALFFSAPVSIPIVFGGAGAGIVALVLYAYKGKRGCEGDVTGHGGGVIALFSCHDIVRRLALFIILGAVVVGGIAGGVILSYHSWNHIVGFVYTSDVAKIAAIAGGALIGIGGILHFTSDLLKNRAGRAIFT